MVKFFKTTYLPLDKDIVREMWVLGDLKDRLGIKHRRDRRNNSDLENTPMFQKPHSRSVSEVSFNGGGYEPANTQSPGDGLVGGPRMMESYFVRRSMKSTAAVHQHNVMGGITSHLHVG